jgi:hypothetical protein
MPRAQPSNRRDKASLIPLLVLMAISTPTSSAFAKASGFKGRQPKWDCPPKSSVGRFIARITQACVAGQKAPEHLRSAVLRPRDGA